MSRETNENAFIAITGRGMVSSLGSDVVSACAAARAGLVRPAPLDLQMGSPEDGQADHVQGHPAGELTRGFEGFARLLRLAALGLGDLLKQVPDGPWMSRQTGMYLALPCPHRIHTGLDLIANKSTRAVRDEKARQAMDEPEPDIASRLLRAAAQLAGWPVDPPLRFSATSGHTGVAEALQRAMDDLQRGYVSAAVVGGVDSLLEEEVLMWLHNTGRLKRSGVPVGLLPGEAGAFLLLEPLHTIQRRGSRPLAVAQAVHLEDEDGTLLSGAPAQGVALAKALAKVVDTASFHQSGAAWVLSDHNGEIYRAAEWGHVLVRLASRVPELASPVVWYPASSFGDVGAASGAVAICLAIHAFSRGCAPNPTAVVVSSSEGACRAVTLIHEPEAWRRRV